MVTELLLLKLNHVVEANAVEEELRNRRVHLTRPFSRKQNDVCFKSDFFEFVSPLFVLVLIIVKAVKWHYSVLVTK